jgi:2-polyprenyl-3-methyl-5-hydroxy-6-metoxy-1,4-benzoquinol methylase
VTTSSWDEVFEEDYLYFSETLLTPDRNDREAALLVRLLGLPAQAEVLDAPCGHGRIANRLARMGYRVTGLDKSRPFLERARREAEEWGVQVDYVEGDVRRLPWTERFDAVINWFTSFGYFDDEENRLVLREAHRALRPGGRLVVEMIARDRVVQQVAANGGEWVGVVERDGNLLVDRTRFDVLTSRVETERLLHREGRVRRVRYSVRAYTFPELRDELIRVGFREVHGFGEDGSPLTVCSRRMIVVAEK